MPWAGLVFDEAHYLKNHTSARSKLARQLAEQAQPRSRRRSRAVYLLTGTPLTNRPRDLFVLLQLVGPSARAQLPVVRQALLRRGKERYGWKTDGASNLEELTVQLHGVDAAAHEGGGAFASAEVAHVAADHGADGHRHAGDA